MASSREDGSKKDFPDATYILPRNTEEVQRLQLQHDLIKEFDQGKVILAPYVATANDKVLDIGTGSGTWIKDAVSVVPPSVSLIGLDINSRLWDPALISTYPNVAFIQGTVTSLPSSWTETFSLVQQRLLLPCLKRHEWPIAIAEIYRVLRPGGWVQLTEHVVWQGGPCTEKMQSEYYRKLYDEKNGLWSEVMTKMPELLSEAGFEDVQAIERPLPMGSWGGKVGEMARKNAGDVLRALAVLSAEKGFVKEEVEKLIRDAEEEWDNRRCTAPLNTFIARKP